MTSRRFVPVAIALVALSAACGTSGDGSDTGPDDAVGSLGDAVEVAAGAPAAAGAQACDLELQMLQTAADTFFALTGSLPTTEQELVDEGLLREPSELFDLTADGELVAVPAGPCV